MNEMRVEIYREDRRIVFHHFCGTYDWKTDFAAPGEASEIQLLEMYVENCRMAMHSFSRSLRQEVADAEKLSKGR